MDGSGLLSDEECRAIVRKRLQLHDDADVDILAVVIEPISKDTKGIMGEHLSVKIAIAPSAGQLETLSFFAKSLPRNVQDHRRYVESMGAFEKESRVYGEVLPRLDSAPWSCDCLLTRKDVIVLKDLRVEGFSLLPSCEADFDHCALVLRTAANMHAAAIALEHSLPDGEKLDDAFPGLFSENVYVPDEDNAGGQWFRAGLKAAIRLVDELPPGDWDKEEAKRRLPEVWTRLYQLLKKSSKYRNVFCHGDLWPNNMLFRYDESGKPSEVCFLDLQIVRYNPPAHDIIYFLYIATTREFRRRHWAALTSLYYSELERQLLGRGLSVEDVVPRAELEASLEELRDSGRILAAACYQTCLMPGDRLAPYMASVEDFKQFIQVDRSEEVARCFREDEHYRRRLTDALQELIECTVFNK